MDYHYNKSQIFYADVNVDKINVADLKNLSNTKTIVANGIDTPNGIAIDWIANNMYWTDVANQVKLFLRF